MCWLCCFISLSLDYLWIVDCLLDKKKIDYLGEIVFFHYFYFIYFFKLYTLIHQLITKKQETD